MDLKIIQQPGQNIYFTSDTHYNHTNICGGVSKWTNKGGCRAYDTLDHMNSVLVNNINAIVGENDILFHLGDWSFGGIESIFKFRERIVCKNIHLVLGNHDHHIKHNKQNTRELFTSVSSMINLTIVDISGNSHTFILFHYPIASWPYMSDGVIHLHGHVHLPPRLKLSAGKAMDVGVDGNHMNPYMLNEIVRIMHKQPIASLSLTKDHHQQI